MDQFREKVKSLNVLRHFQKEWLLGEVLIVALAILWYDNLWWIAGLQVLMIPYGIYLGQLRKKRDSKMYEKGFYDYLQALLPSLQAGYSLENACLSAAKEFFQMAGRKHPFSKKLAILEHGIEVHIPLEELFLELAQATENEDIYQFSIILGIIRNMGGNSIDILRNSMLRIQKKMETSEEIRTLLSGKIYEKNLMVMMPFFMVLYLRIANPSYLGSLYHTVVGQILMSAILLGILGCFYWTEQILHY